MDWDQLDRSAHAVGQNCFHLTWTPKYRYPVFRFPNYVREMDAILRGIAARHHLTLHELCIEADHVHCFAAFPPTMSLSQALQLLKGGSAFAFRRLHPGLQRYKALWSRGKFYRSIGSVTTEAVHRYINDSHHSTRMPRTQTRLAAGADPRGLARAARDGNCGL